MYIINLKPPNLHRPGTEVKSMSASLLDKLKDMPCG